MQHNDYRMELVYALYSLIYDDHDNITIMINVKQNCFKSMYKNVKKKNMFFFGDVYPHASTLITKKKN